MSSDVTTAGAHGHEGHGDHPSNRFYWFIGTVLAVVTFVEVAIYYMTAFDALEAPLLVILSTAKVILVVMFFMHLKFDSRVFTWVFVAGVVLAAFMVMAMVALYHFIPYVRV